MNKRGQSQIITTILIILLVLVAIVIVSNVINKIIIEGSKEVDINPLLFKGDMEYAIIDKKNILLKINRGAGGGIISGVKIFFVDNIGVTYSYENKNDIPNQLNNIIYTINSLELIPPDPGGFDFNLLQDVSIRYLYQKEGNDVVTKIIDSTNIPIGCFNGYTLSCGATDVGECEFGTNTCSNEIWGTCIGEIVSVPEICYDGLDNNCDGITDEGCINITDLISWWNMDDLDGSGNPTDFIGTNDATIWGNPVQTTSGQIGNAFDFDGNGDYLEIANPSAFNFPGKNLSFFAWINIAQTGVWHTIMSKNPNIGGLTEAYTFYITSGNRLLVVLNDNEYTVFGNSNFNINQWYHVGFVFNNTDTVIYIDGIVDKSLPTPTTLNSNILNFRLGGHVSALLMKGKIDEAMIYDRELSPAEVLDIYNIQI